MFAVFRSAWRSLLFLLVLLASALAIPSTSVKMTADFGFEYADENDLGPEQLLTVTAFDGSVFSFAVASRVGGVIPQGEAQPEDPSTSVAEIEYDPSKPDGQRFSLKQADQFGTVELPDWAMMPLIRFVASPWTAAMTLLGEPKTESEELAALFRNLMFIEIHPAFKDSVVGNNFIFTDAMLVGANPNRIRQVTEHLSSDISGYTNLAAFDEAKSAAAAKSISEELEGRGNFWNTYIFTDVDVKYKYSLRNGMLNIKGEPYYAFLNVDVDSKSVSFDKESTDFLKSMSLLLDLNPKIYMLDINLFRVASVLRHIKLTNEKNWNEIVKKTESSVIVPSMITPRAWRRSG